MTDLDKFQEWLVKQLLHQLEHVFDGMEKYVLGMILSMSVEDLVAVTPMWIVLVVLPFALRQDIVKRKFP